MKFQIGEVGKTNRDDDESVSEGWETIAESPQELVDFLNDCDDSSCTGFNGNVIENHWLRVIQS